MSNPFQSPTTASQVATAARGQVLLRLMRLLIAYLSLSIVTLPFIDALWIGEVPVLALFQLPKIELALWLRQNIVMPLIAAAGMSQGSFSPDWLLAGPFALAISYLGPLGVLLALVWWRTRLRSPHGRVLLTLSAACVIDYACVMAFGTGPGLSIY